MNQVQMFLALWSTTYHDSVFYFYIFEVIYLLYLHCYLTYNPSTLNFSSLSIIYKLFLTLSHSWWEYSSSWIKDWTLDNEYLLSFLFNHKYNEPIKYINRHINWRGFVYIYFFSLLVLNPYCALFERAISCYIRKHNKI